MSKVYTISDQDKPYFITATVVDWIDVFTRKIYRDILIESLKYNIENKGLIVYAYVIMSNHFHCIIQAKNSNLSEILRDFKKHTSKAILNAIHQEPESRREWMLERFNKAKESHHRNTNFQFWQYGNHAEEIYSQAFFWTKIDYIHFNPVRAEIVKRPQDFIYSSASNYIDNTGLLKVTLADNPVVNTLNLSNVLKMNSYD
ncbi:MAG: transposase [Epsilonproteobacteria bacterium]|nr:transposase [Campylobacterota bacterium]